MDNMEKTAKFEQAINSAADAEIKGYLEQAQKAAEEALKSVNTEYLDKSDNSFLSETEKIKKSFEHQLSQKQFDASREVFAHRTKRVEEFFSQLKQEIADFTQTPEYENKLFEIIKEIEGDYPFDEATVLYVRQKDLDKVKEKYPKLKVEVDKKIKLGGVSVFYPNMSLFLDKTFDNSFENQKAEFVNNKIMQL